MLNQQLTPVGQKVTGTMLGNSYLIRMRWARGLGRAVNSDDVFAAEADVFEKTCKTAKKIVTPPTRRRTTVLMSLWKVKQRRKKEQRRRRRRLFLRTQKKERSS